MNYSLVNGSATDEPITLAEAKLHLKVDVTDDDDLITALISAAREWCENYTRRSYCDRTLTLRMDHFPTGIKLPRGPVLSVTSITYIDTDGNSQTLATDQYQVDTYGVPARITPPVGIVWPVTKIGGLNGVSVLYSAGYGTGGSPFDASVVPASLKAAMKLLIGHWYMNREAVSAASTPPQMVPMAVTSLLAPLEVRDFTLE